MNLKHILFYSLFILYCLVGILQSSARNADRQEIVNYTNRYTFSCITMQDGLPHVFVDDVVEGVEPGGFVLEEVAQLGVLFVC